MFLPKHDTEQIYMICKVISEDKQLSFTALVLNSATAREQMFAHVKMRGKTEGVKVEESSFSIFQCCASKTIIKTSQMDSIIVSILFTFF